MPVALGLATVLVLIAGLAGLAVVRHEWDRPARIAGWVGEALLVAYVAWDLVQLRGGDRPDNVAVHLGYCLAAVGLIPALTVRPVPPGGEEQEEPAEPDDEGGAVSTGVLAIACLACAAIVVRMAQTR